MVNCLIKKARVCDPTAGLDEIRDFCIEDGIIAGRPSHPESHYDVIAGENVIITPGLIDLHVHFREPGDEDSETIETGSRAAARGGFTHVVTMPNTTPATDSADLIMKTIASGRKAGFVNILPSACVTLGRLGQGLAPLEQLAEAGASAFTDDGTAVADSAIMKEALEQAAILKRPIMQHAVAPEISAHGVIRDCTLARKLGLSTFDPAAESTIVARDIELAAASGGHLHVQHISCSETLALLRSAMQSSAPVTSEVTPHHLALSAADIITDDPNYKMNPPLGSAEDREALVEAVIDGTISCFATDHAPHGSSRKSSGFARSAFGVIGLETAAAITYDLLVHSGLVSLGKWASLWTTAPAGIINLPPPSLAPGQPANAAFFRAGPRKIHHADILSKSKNTPFLGRETSLNPVMTVCNGRQTWRSPDC